MAVGPSGAGKTTCTHLLQRLWDPIAGRITIGGCDLRNFPEHQLRALMTAVSQDVYLFNTTVAENLRIAKPVATDAELRHAAKLALASEFIEALPDGYGTVLGERGASLSGGQRQRLAIARALLRDAPILIFDEAASNLDSESERELRTALKLATVGRSTLVIAHRPSTIRMADRFIVLDQGTVVEAGTFDALIASRGALARLLQPEAFRNDGDPIARPGS